MIGAINLTIRLDADLCIQSIASIAAVAGLEDGPPLDIDCDSEACRFEGTPIWRVVRETSDEPGTLKWAIRPLPGLCLLVTAVLRLVPGAQVAWEQGWPVMTPPQGRDDGDDEEPPAPDPAPRQLEPVG